MVRVLHILGGFHYGGAEQLLINVYHSIDRTKVQFDFLTRSDNERKQVEEIEALGGKVYNLPDLKHPFQHYKAINRFFDEHPEYDIVHMHMNALIFIHPLIIARKHNIKVRIVHSHNTMTKGKTLGLIIHNYLKKKIDKIATHCIACGKEAGAWMFGDKKAQIWYNAVQTKKFAFNPRIREAIRKEFGIEDEIVFGNVGRFSQQKNLFFLVDILEEAKRIVPNVRLLLIGNGKQKSELRAYIKEKKLEKSVIFISNSNRVNKLLWAIDVFVMPSLYEGLSLALLEAQAAGLPCVISDTISEEGIVLSSVQVLSLSQSAKVWAETALKMNGATDRIAEGLIVRNSIYDITYLSNKIETFYSRQVNGPADSSCFANGE